MHIARKIGLTGGLKEIEKQIGIDRPANLVGSPIDAYRAYKASNDQEYLQLLIQYNEQDCISLELLIKYCCKELEAKVYKENSH